MPGLQFGLVLGTRRLAARVGADTARDLLETSATFDAERALHARFITRIAGREDWPEAIVDAAEAAGALTADAAARMHARTLADTRDADMASLAASATVPGLKDRIRRYRAAQLQK
jgi:enoyl-CoA hydratase/carnithine racemase